MSWQNTVLTESKLHEIWLSHHPTDNDALVDIAKVQAEASFKAGQEAGRQEVVESLWWEDTCYQSGIDGSPIREIRMSESEWQAKLKDWGIKE